MRGHRGELVATPQIARQLRREERHRRRTVRAARCSHFSAVADAAIQEQDITTRWEAETKRRPDSLAEKEGKERWPGPPM